MFSIVDSGPKAMARFRGIGSGLLWVVLPLQSCVHNSLVSLCFVHSGARAAISPVVMPLVRLIVDCVSYILARSIMVF